jgi:hypothetical protein
MKAPVDSTLSVFRSTSHGAVAVNVLTLPYGVEYEDCNLNSPVHPEQLSESGFLRRRSDKARPQGERHPFCISYDIIP